MKTNLYDYAETLAKNTPRCRIKRCKNIGGYYGYCLAHFLKGLDKFERESWKSNLMVKQKI